MRLLLPLLCIAVLCLAEQRIDLCDEWKEPPANICYCQDYEGTTKFQAPEFFTTGPKEGDKLASV